MPTENQPRVEIYGGAIVKWREQERKDLQIVSELAATPRDEIVSNDRSETDGSGFVNNALLQHPNGTIEVLADEDGYFAPLVIGTTPRGIGRLVTTVNNPLIAESHLTIKPDPTTGILEIIGTRSNAGTYVSTPGKELIQIIAAEAISGSVIFIGNPTLRTALAASGQSDGIYFGYVKRENSYILQVLPHGFAQRLIEVSHLHNRKTAINQLADGLKDVDQWLRQ